MILMKRMTRIAFAALAITALYACTGLIENAGPASGVETHIVFTATNEGFSQDTKTVRMEDGSTWWLAMETISVFCGSGSDGGSKFRSSNTSLQKIVEFEGSIQAPDPEKEFWAVYPYSQENQCDGTSITTIIPSVQTAWEGNFSGNAFPAIAKSKTLDLAFWNICGGIKFSVSRNDIKSVKLKGNNGETLAGKVKVSFDASGVPAVTEVIDGRSVMTLIAPGGGTFKTGEYYYLTLLPTALDSGFTISFNTSTETGSVVSNNAQTVKRSIFGVLNNIDSKVSEWKSSVEPEYVDLGLPSGLKWATFNVGTSKPEEFGDYFAWGETEPKTDYKYNWSNYKWCNGSGDKLTKYCTDSSIWDSSAPMDRKTRLDLEDDAAYINWGGSWRTPTYAEWTELQENCTWTWTEVNGRNGRLVTSKTNNNSVFLPLAGFRDDISINYSGFEGYYWSSSLNADDPSEAYYVLFSQNYVLWKYTSRYRGLAVRAVYGDMVYPESVSLNKSTLSLCMGYSEQLTATVIPSYASVKDVVWSSDDTDVVTVNKQGVVSALKAGTATITVTTTMGGKTATCEVTVMDLSLPASVEAVDLGLPSGLKWATCNVGATKAEEYGVYFAWGETAPKTNYNWSNYKWCNGAYNKLTKYCTQSSFWDGSEPMDNKTVLDAEDDAARANWGAGWRMPTDADWTELINNCTWIWSELDGVKGRFVLGSNGNSIFLPASGYRGGSNLGNAGVLGYYSTASPVFNDSPNRVWNVIFNSDDIGWDASVRYYGNPVRPVTE